MDDEGLIARNLLTRMEAKALGPKALSLKAGLNETYVRDILKGRSRNPRQGHLQKLALALECRVSDLTGEAVPPTDLSSPTETDKSKLLAIIEKMNSKQHQALLPMATLVYDVEKPGGQDNTQQPPRRGAA